MSQEHRSDEVLKELAGKYWELVKYPSVQMYLKNAIGSRSSGIPGVTSLEEKLAERNISNYLRGVKLFFEYSDRFNTPREIIQQFNQVRTNPQEIDSLCNHIDNYIVWLNQDYSESTSTAYQAQFRGFLKWNYISLQLKDYAVDSEKKKTRDKLDIGYEKLLEFANRIPSYISKRTEFEKYLITKWLHISGLGSREILSLRFGELRPKFIRLRKNYIEIKKRRKKTNISFHTFVYGEVLEDLSIYLDQNQDKPGDAYLFGDPKRAYERLNFIISSVVNTIIERNYPDWLPYHREQTLFTPHDYRHIFITTCRNLAIPIHYEKIFVGHKISGTDKSYVEKSTVVLSYFKKIQEHLFTELYDNTEII